MCKASVGNLSYLIRYRSFSIFAKYSCNFQVPRDLSQSDVKASGSRTALSSLRGLDIFPIISHFCIVDISMDVT